MTCSEEGCDRPQHAYGRCRSHYDRARAGSKALSHECPLCGPFSGSGGIGDECPTCKMTPGEHAYRARILAHDVYAFDTPEDRDAATDYLFVWYGVRKEYDGWMVNGLTPDKREALDAGALRVPAEFRGPFSWARLDAEKVTA